MFEGKEIYICMYIRIYTCVAKTQTFGIHNWLVGSSYVHIDMHVYIYIYVYICDYDAFTDKHGGLDLAGGLLAIN